MPTLAFKCTCGETWEAWIRSRNGFDVCPKCGKRKKGRAPFGAPMLKRFFRAGWYDNLDAEPVYCATKGDYFDECKKRNLVPVGMQ